MADTVALLMATENDDNRQLVVCHRQTRPEVFVLTFERGRLVEIPPTMPAPIPTGIELSPAEQDVVVWSAQQDWFTSVKLRKHRPMSGTVAGELLAGLVTKGVLETQERGQRINYRRVRQSCCTLAEAA